MCNFVVPSSKSGGAVFPTSSPTYGCKTKQRKQNKQTSKQKTAVFETHNYNKAIIYKHQTNYFVSDDQ